MFGGSNSFIAIQQHQLNFGRVFAREKSLFPLSRVFLKCLLGDDFQAFEEVGEDFGCALVFGLFPSKPDDFLRWFFVDFFEKLCLHLVQGRRRGLCKRLIEHDCLLSEKVLEVLKVRFLSQSVTHRSNVVL